LVFLSSSITPFLKSVLNDEYQSIPKNSPFLFNFCWRLVIDFIIEDLLLQVIAALSIIKSNFLLIGIFFVKSSTKRLFLSFGYFFFKKFITILLPSIP